MRFFSGVTMTVHLIIAVAGWIGRSLDAESRAP
jgi:hypothetical protein